LGEVTSEIREVTSEVEEEIGRLELTKVILEVEEEMQMARKKATFDLKIKKIKMFNFEVQKNKILYLLKIFKDLSS